MSRAKKPTRAKQVDRRPAIQRAAQRAGIKPRPAPAGVCVAKQELDALPAAINAIIIEVLDVHMATDAEAQGNAFVNALSDLRDLYYHVQAMEIRCGGGAS